MEFLLAGQFEHRDRDCPPPLQSIQVTERPQGDLTQPTAVGKLSRGKKSGLFFCTPPRLILEKTHFGWLAQLLLKY
jgi:hypothetical protein